MSADEHEGSALRVQQLNEAHHGIDHVDQPLAVDGDTLGPEELARPAAVLAEDRQRLAGGRELLHPLIDRVGHVQVAARAENHVGGSVEFPQAAPLGSERSLQVACSQVVDLHAVPLDIQHEEFLGGDGDVGRLEVARLTVPSLVVAVTVIHDDLAVLDGVGNVTQAGGVETDVDGLPQLALPLPAEAAETALAHVHDRHGKLQRVGDVNLAVADGDPIGLPDDIVFLLLFLAEYEAGQAAGFLVGLVPDIHRAPEIAEKLHASRVGGLREEHVLSVIREAVGFGLWTAAQRQQKDNTRRQSHPARPQPPVSVRHDRPLLSSKPGMRRGARDLPE